MVKIFNFFKKLFGRSAERDRKIALLEINYNLLKKQYEELIKIVTELKTISNRTQADTEPPSPQQILDEWLNGEEGGNE